MEQSPRDYFPPRGETVTKMNWKVWENGQSPKLIRQEKIQQEGLEVGMMGKAELKMVKPLQRFPNCLFAEIAPKRILENHTIPSHMAKLPPNICNCHNSK